MYFILQIALGVTVGLFLFNLLFGSSGSTYYTPPHSQYRGAFYSDPEINCNLISRDGYTIVREENHCPKLATAEEQLENEKIRIQARLQMKIRNKKFDIC